MEANVNVVLAEAVALIIGHASVAAADGEGTESSSASGDPGPGAGFAEVVRDHVALQDFLQRRGCYIETGTVCDTDLTCGSCMRRIRDFFSSERPGLRILMFLGHGAEQTGAWRFTDGDIKLTEINDAWNSMCRTSQDTLLIYSDSCYSGHLCLEASRMGACFFVQASCGQSETALENVFTAMWMRVHLDPENHSSILDRFEAQNQQGVMYYAPQQAASVQTLTCGPLLIRLLGKCISDCAGNVQSAGSLLQSQSQARGQELFEKLPGSLQLVVAELLARPGWSLADPAVVNIVEGIHAKCKQEARRGHDEAADLSDIEELLKEFVQDLDLSPVEALDKFNEEFD